MEDIVNAIGRKVKALRLERGFSLHQLAHRAGLSPAGIHKIERQGMVPSIASIMKLAAALDTSVSYFVEEEPPAKDVELVRRRARKRLLSARSNILTEYIAGDLVHGLLQAGFFSLRPGSRSDTRPSRHPGEELILCLQGRVEFTVGEQVHALGPGDAIHFETELPHRFVNQSHRPARLLWVTVARPRVLGGGSVP